MNVIPLCLYSFLFGTFISFSGATVLLEIVGGKSSFQEGSEVQLLCTISPYNNAMTWYVNNDIYADCFVGSCGASPNKPYTFTYNFDESNGNFSLTIDSVNSSHANLLFTCDDGNERKDITFNVTQGQINTPISNTVTSTSSSKPANSITVRDSSKEDEDNDIGLKIGIGVGGTVLISGAGVMTWRHFKSKDLKEEEDEGIDNNRVHTNTGGPES